jgi:hypothetical protein
MNVYRADRASRSEAHHNSGDNGDKYPGAARGKAGDGDAVTRARRTNGLYAAFAAGQASKSARSAATKASGWSIIT